MRFFCFDHHKAIQATAALLRPEEGERLSYLRLLKLLYIADRESIKETGRSITGDRAVAMDHGPVLESVYQGAKGTAHHSPSWARYFRVWGYQIAMKDDPGVGLLSRFELSKLREVADRYAGMSDWELVEVTHGFDEWKRNWKDGTSRPIPAEDIIEAVGRGDDLEQIKQDEQDKADFNRLLGG